MHTERRQITAAPGHEIDRGGQVFRVANGRAAPIPADAAGRVKLHAGGTVITADKRTLLALAFPDMSDAEMPEPEPEPVEVAEPEPVEVAEPEPDLDLDRKTPRKTSKRTSRSSRGKS